MALSSADLVVEEGLLFVMLHMTYHSHLRYLHAHVLEGRFRKDSCEVA